MNPADTKFVLCPVIIWVLYLTLLIEVHHGEVSIGALHKDFHRLLLHLRSTHHQSQLKR